MRGVTHASRTGTVLVSHMRRKRLSALLSDKLPGSHERCIGSAPAVCDRRSEMKLIAGEFPIQLLAVSRPTGLAGRLLYGDWYCACLGQRFRGETQPMVPSLRHVTAESGAAQSS
jgi:hypothetical protein